MAISIHIIQSPFRAKFIEGFSLKLREAFQHIAEVNFMVTTEQSELEEKEIINLLEFIYILHR